MKAASSFLTGRPVALARRAAPAARRSSAATRRPAVCQSSVTFKKYQGLGNDFILVDNRHQEEPVITEDEAVKLCDRNFGIGGDGVIFALPPIGDTDYTMRIFNSDGSEPEMCGNGIRCLARFVGDIDGTGPSTQKVHTLAGLIVPVVKDDGQVCVDMGEPILTAADVPTTLAANEGDAVVAGPIEVDGEEWRVTTVSMGNPHALVFGKTGSEEFEKGTLDVNALDLHAIGPKFENHPAFPARTNTEFCQVLSRSRIRMRVWERGAGPTLACGTGACATVVAGVLEGRVDRTCTVDLPGGPLEIEWRESDNHIYMTGPAEYVFGGTVDC